MFALSIESLACGTWDSRARVGFVREGGEDRIVLYADDLLVFLGDTANSLIACMEIVQRFGAALEYAVNWDKSSLLY